MQTLSLLVVSVLCIYLRFLRLSLHFLLRMFMDMSSTFKFISQASELACGILLLGYVSPFFNLLGLLLISFFFLRFIRSPLRLFNNKREKSISRDDDISRDDNSEDEVFDVMSLRRMVKEERQRYNTAIAEIEKEQGAAASAAEEAMAMILRLQSEKSAVEIQAKQFRRMVEQKQEYDVEVIDSLRWTVQQVESRKDLLERQLEALRERLRQFLNDREEIQDLQEEQGTPTPTPSDVDVDPDSSAFLNFSIEYDDVIAASSSPNHSPPHTPQHL